MRIDKYLVENAYFESRTRALDAIKAGKVKINGKIVKASAKVDTTSSVDVANEKFYVSRAARKLEGFLEEYPLDMQSSRALDIGSSTGGFAQIVLEGGVRSLDCVDVGRGQLHSSLKEDARITLHEEMDIRAYENPQAFELITCDVSFISILQITEHIDRLAQDGTNIIILYKPQFEVGKDVKRDSKGVVTDLDAIERKKEAFEVHCAALEWSLKQKAVSKVAGRSGNIEYLYHYKKEKIGSECATA